MKYLLFLLLFAGKFVLRPKTSFHSRQNKRHEKAGRLFQCSIGKNRAGKLWLEINRLDTEFFTNNLCRQDSDPMMWA